jgi:hypothetical protein
MIGHGDGFLESLGLVIYAAGSYGVDIAPIFFRLGMHQRIAIDLRSRGYEDPGLFGLGESQAVVGAKAADLQGLDGYLQVVDRAGRAGEMEDISQLTRYMDEFADVMMVEFKILQLEKVFYILHVPRDEIVHPDDMVTFLYKTIA